ncbi:adenylyltransferase/cytidyltransferase family protein [Candidatus Thioglobus sp.]|uniref:adenylyltransferase/cytidyltransferase family protein n=1 Tax=Candidatus Thioglobus sp. TaxID=2026721 RepID=UPI00345C61A0
MVKKKIVITYGTFDMLHRGHMRLLERAKDFGDYLIVGVTDEDYDRSRGKLNVAQSTEQRVEAIKAIEFVDEVIIESHRNQKSEDMVKYKVDTFAIGDDWLGMFDYLNKYTQVVYLPRTQGISSTQLRSDIFGTVKLGIANLGRNTKQFIDESKFVSNLDINQVYSQDSKAMEEFTNESNDVAHGYNNYTEFLGGDIDAVYINCQPDERYALIKKTLEHGKHVLCARPSDLSDMQRQELLDLAKNKRLVFLSELKKDYLSALNHEPNGCGFRYMMAEFTSLIQRNSVKS